MSRATFTTRRPWGVASAVGLAAGLMGGCETDSFFDPSVVGRWEDTPTVMPIIERMSAIEDEDTQFVQSSPVQAQDLIPEVEQLRLGPGDQVEARVPDLEQVGVEGVFARELDPQGFIDLPRLEPINLDGMTRAEARRAIVEAVRAANLIGEPVVTLNVLSQRTRTFSIIGAVANPTTYLIPAPNYRLLEALTAAGGINETVPFIYVIRQVPLSDEASGRAPAPVDAPVDAVEPARPPQEGEDLIDLLDELARPRAEPERPVEPPAPGVLGSIGGRGRAQPGGERRASPPPAPVAPPIDLPDSRRAQPAPEGLGQPTSGWRYENGQWVRVAGGSRAGSSGGSGGAAGEEGGTLLTQRVIEVPTKALLAGVASVNIVVRPGDVIRVPPPQTGLVYMTGQVSRVGPYSLPPDGRLTLLRSFTAAGGLGTLAIPERIDITRVVGPGRQATIRVNGRAIAEQTQPDLYLKPDDIVNVGTNFWAYPLAVIRGGFRMSYGFGFLLDRNFDDEIFGPEQTNFN